MHGSRCRFLKRELAATKESHESLEESIATLAARFGGNPDDERNNCEWEEPVVEFQRSLTWIRRGYRSKAADSRWGGIAGTVARGGAAEGVMHGRESSSDSASSLSWTNKNARGARRRGGCRSVASPPRVRGDFVLSGEGVEKLLRSCSSGDSERQRRAVERAIGTVAQLEAGQSVRLKRVDMM